MNPIITVFLISVTILGPNFRLANCMLFDNQTKKLETLCPNQDSLKTDDSISLAVIEGTRNLNDPAKNMARQGYTLQYSCQHKHSFVEGFETNVVEATCSLHGFYKIQNSDNFRKAEDLPKKCVKRCPAYKSPFENSQVVLFTQPIQGSYAQDDKGVIRCQDGYEFGGAEATKDVKIWCKDGLFQPIVDGKYHCVESGCEPLPIANPESYTIERGGEPNSNTKRVPVGSTVTATCKGIEIETVWVSQCQLDKTWSRHQNTISKCEDFSAKVKKAKVEIDNQLNDKQKEIEGLKNQLSSSNNDARKKEGDLKNRNNQLQGQLTQKLKEIDSIKSYVTQCVNGEANLQHYLNKNTRKNSIFAIVIEAVKKKVQKCEKQKSDFSKY